MVRWRHFSLNSSHKCQVINARNDQEWLIGARETQLLYHHISALPFHPYREQRKKEKERKEKNEKREREKERDPAGSLRRRREGH